MRVAFAQSQYTGTPSQPLAAATPDGTVRRSGSSHPGKLDALACESAGRTLSEKEWKTFLLSDTCQPGEPCPGLPKAE